MTLNPPTSPMTRPATPTFDDYAPSEAHDDVRLAPTPTAPQPPPFSPLYMPLNRPHSTSPQPLHRMRPQLLPPPALKRASQELPPPESRPPQDKFQPPLNKQKAEAAAEVQHDQIEHARPLDWDSRSRNSRKKWKKTRGKTMTETQVFRPSGLGMRFLPTPHTTDVHYHLTNPLTTLTPTQTCPNAISDATGDFIFFGNFPPPK